MKLSKAQHSALVAIRDGRDRSLDVYGSAAKALIARGWCTASLPLLITDAGEAALTAHELEIGELS